MLTFTPETTRSAYDRATGRHRTVASTGLTRLVSAIGSETARLGMESHLIIGHEVYTFDDIDFTVLRPIVALGPNTGPYLKWNKTSVTAQRKRVVYAQSNHKADAKRR